MLGLPLASSTACTKTLLIPTNCVVLDTPEYPEGIEWELCVVNEAPYPCLELDNAKKLAKYLAAVERYHDSIEQTCNKLEN